MAIALRLLHDQRCQVFRQLMTEFRIVGNFDLVDTRDPGGGLGDRAAVLASHQQIDVATDLLCRGDRMQSCRGNFVVVVFYDYQVAHF